MAAHQVAAAAAAQPVTATSSVSASTPQPAAHLVDDLRPLWQVRDDWSNWVDYDKDFSDFLELSYQKGEQSVQCIPGKNVQFTYFLPSFVQQNDETKRRRPMRRVLIQSHMQDSLPEILKHCDEHNAKYHSLEESHKRTGTNRSRSTSRPRSVTRSSR